MKPITINPLIASMILIIGTIILALFTYIMKKGIDSFLEKFKAITDNLGEKISSLTEASKAQTKEIKNTQIDTAKIEEKVNGHEKWIGKVESQIVSHIEKQMR